MSIYFWKQNSSRSASQKEEEKETFDAATIIHGAYKENLSLTVDDLLDTINSKCKSKELSGKIIHSKQPLFLLIFYIATGEMKGVLNTKNYSTFIKISQYLQKYIN